MVMLAEIADKMPSIGDIVWVPMAAATVCAGVALVDRELALAMLSVTLLVGGLIAYDAFNYAFVSGPMRDGVWIELGWPWVLAAIFSPLMPAGCVAGVILLRRSRSAGRGFPMDVGM